MTDIEFVELDAQVNQLRERRRSELPVDAFVTDYDGIDENGHKYSEVLVLSSDPGAVSKTEIDLTALNQPAPSTTHNLDLLALEAEMVAEGRDLKNPHIPASEHLMEQARDRIEANGHDPAWEYRL